MDPQALARYLVQLLAPRPQHKHELLARLERTRGSLQNGAQLLAVLEQVAQPEPGGHRYRLREELLGQVQEDWPGYTPAERQLLAQLLHRKQELGAWAGPSLVPRQEGAETPAQQNTGKKPWGMKRLALPASCRPPQLKRARVAEASLESCPGSLQEPRPEPARAQPQPEQPSRPSTPGETSSSEEASEDWEEGTLCLEQDLAVLGGEWLHPRGRQPGQ
ncbi:hypothetical protein Y1Q_0020668 [Alligator mississippiensis]|uniref:RNA polymerase II elongation factor ELL N-terminal domain-containing protein n=1 Tax=Alligator mississippiensis TaxID=8496 RepID=A0A151P4R7_ALLMI|nr:hypothetical protein Y1Q_0020668 [Alligator mississippiensis]